MEGCLGNISFKEPTPMSVWVRKARQAIVTTALLLVLAVGGIAYAKPGQPMPPMVNPVPAEEGIVECSPTFIIGGSAWRSRDTQDPSLPYKYVIFFLPDNIVFMMYVDSNPKDPKAPYTLYYDLDGDGKIDREKVIQPGTGKPIFEVACAAGAEAKTIRAKKRG